MTQEYDTTTERRLWFSGAWGRSLPTSFLQFGPDCIACHYNPELESKKTPTDTKNSSGKAERLNALGCLNLASNYAVCYNRTTCCGHYEVIPWLLLDSKVGGRIVIGWICQYINKSDYIRAYGKIVIGFYFSFHELFGRAERSETIHVLNWNEEHLKMMD